MDAALKKLPSLAPRSSNSRTPPMGQRRSSGGGAHPVSTSPVPLQLIVFDWFAPGLISRVGACRSQLAQSMLGGAKAGGPAGHYSQRPYRVLGKTWAS